MEKIKVVLRLRPQTQEEEKRKIQSAWDIERDIDQIKAKDSNLHHHPFNFDQLFTEESSNKDVYNIACKEIIEKTLEGIDTTIFVFGQTGAGKTHTMLGPPKTYDFTGIIFQSLCDIFKRVENKEQGEMFKITCSYIEIYNEIIYDLLNKPNELKEGLQIFEDTEKQNFFVQGKTLINIESLEEVEQVLRYGETNRRYAQTYFNHKSSRSHTIFSVQIRYSKVSDTGENFIKESLTNFVDLAGNERLLFEYKQRQIKGNLKRSYSVTKGSSNISRDFYNNNNELKTRKHESKNINTSLFYLTQVIHLCAKGKNMKHIPFRNSPLTKILRSSLGGNSRTLLILCVSPTKPDFDITLSTLRFGKCAKTIENKIKPNVLSSYDKQAIQKIINEYEMKFSHYENRIKELEEKQFNFLDFWRKYGNVKNQMIVKLLGLERKKIQKNQYQLHKYQLYEDRLNYHAGILCSVYISKEEQLNQRFQGENCQNCKIQKSQEKFQAETIPDIFRRFTEKLEKESQIENYFTKAMGLLKQRIDFKTIFKEVKNIFRNLFEEYNSYLDGLMEKVRFYKTELSVYKDPKKLKTLNDQDIVKIYDELKTVYKVYQEEKIRRNVLKDLNAQENVYFSDQESDDEFKKEEKTKLKKVMETIEKELNKKFNFFEKQKVESLQELDKEVKTINQNLSEFIDQIYEQNYSIQKFIFNYHRKTEKKYNFYEKKIEWLRKHAYSDQDQKEDQLDFSDLAKTEFSNGLNEYVIDNKKESYHLDDLNKRFEKIQDYQEKLNDLKYQYTSSGIWDETQQKTPSKQNFSPKNNTQQLLKFQSLRDTNLPQQISKQNQKTESLSNILPLKFSGNQIQSQKNIKKNLNQDVPRPLPVIIPEQKADWINEENEKNFDKKIIEIIDNDLSNSKNPLSLPLNTKSKKQGIFSSQKFIQDSSKNFNLQEFLNKNIQKDIELENFKIKQNDNQQQPFQENFTPIQSQQQSFVTQREAIIELEKKLWKNPVDQRERTKSPMLLESNKKNQNDKNKKPKNYSQKLKKFQRQKSMNRNQ